MSSLRLALKQSLQESGGRTFSTGHGEKKKRKKKKSVGSVSNNSNNNNNAGGVGPSANIAKKGRRNVDSATKRKRGRPRKHYRSEQDHDDDDEIDDATLGEDQPRRRTDSLRDRSRNPRHDHDDEDGLDDDFYSDENEFSYTEDDSDGEVSDDEDVSDDDEDDSPYRSRSRTHHDFDEDEGEEDETMHSDEDDLHPQTSKSQSNSDKTNSLGTTAAIPSEKLDRKDKTDGLSGEKDGLDARNATGSTDTASSQSTNSSQTPSTAITPSNISTSSEDEIKKKLKLLKLKKKLEKNQDSAAHKIQTQWKKKKEKGSASSVSPIVVSTKTNDIGVKKDEIRDSKDNTWTTSSKPEARAGAPPTHSSVGTTESQNNPLQDNFKPSTRDAMVEKKEANKDDPSESAKTKSSLAGSSAAAGDRGSTGNPNGGEAQVSSAKKKKKKKNNSGVVPAPTREVREWSQNMSQKKARKYIQVGMRVKVRFATQAKRDGKTKKIYYGGRVTVVSKRRSKIKIKYDDGTSELSKFPDRDVVVDAVDNGEHAVPADKFIPPSEDQLAETDVAQPVGDEDKEEGEIRDPPAAPTVVPTAATEPEEGEVEETKEFETVTNQPDSSNTGDDRTAQESKKVAVEPLISEKMDIEAEKSAEVHVTPPPGSSLPILLEKEKTGTAVPTSNTPRKDNVETEREPSASEEEGELSPGITITKSSDNLSGKQRDQIATAEVKPLPLTALLPSNLGNETTTTEPIKFAAEKTKVSTSKEVSSKEPEKNIIKPIPEVPTKPKKLSIRIPSGSLATIKGLSSPKSNEIAKLPKATPSTSDVATKDVDDALTDTPESTKDLTSKRKRLASDVVNASNDAPSAREQPSKKRIKVAIGKSLLENSVKKESNDDTAKVKSLPNEDTSEEGLVKEELAPIKEEPVITAKPKKKAKRVDRSRSPRPKSPMPLPEPEKMSSKNSASEIPSIPAPSKQQKIGSKASAFSAKKSVSKEEETATGTKEAASKTSTSIEVPTTSASLRTGRKAAEEAKEKLTVKQKAKLNAKEKEITPHESGKKKKKRRREKEAEEHGEEETEEVEPNETEWVQCDACKKWRILPDNVKASSLPDLWYCCMNIYDPKRSNCEAPEQNMKQILRERKKRARKRAKREAELSESQQEKPTKKAKLQEEEIVAAATTTKKKSKNEKSLAAAGNTPRSISPKPLKSAKSSGAKSKESVTETKKAVAEAKRSNLDGNKKSKSTAEDKPAPGDSGSDTQKEAKKKSKKSKKETQDTSENQDADAADSKKSSRKRGRPSRAQPSSSTQPVSTPVNGNEDEDNVEWVQCDKCEKWRKLPPDISADELPDVWNCSMNTWNPSAASCDAAEDKTDAHHQEIGASEWQLRQTHAGKYSYRQMIFGTGARKHNRPLSERARAAESLFIQPSTDEDQPHPTTQYNKSSAFLPRISNFQKNLMVEENTIGIFDVLRNSNLWEDLRSMDTNPSKVLSSSTGDINIPGQKLKTYEFLSDEIKHAMQDVVLQTLEFGCLTSREIIGKAQWFPYETSIKGVAGIRGYCNEDIIIHTLLDLVRDGLVEMATVRDPFLPISQWVPQYRRVGTRRAIEAVEAIKASRCMKIAKPWKQRPAAETTTNTTEWVTGKKAK